MAVVEYLQGDRIEWGVVQGADKKGLRVRTAQGRDARVSPDKVLFQHEGSEVDPVTAARGRLVQELDVELLWETVRDEAPTAPKEAEELARIYFEGSSSLHASAVYHALVEERFRFRRKGRAFLPRSPDDIAQLRQQEEAQQARAREAAEIREALSNRRPDAPLRDRLERWLRGQEDRALSRVLEDLYKEPTAPIFELLVSVGHLPPTADLPVIRANLRHEHPAAVLSHAAAIPAPERAHGELAGVSIDDPDTREVDDVLTVTEEPSESGAALRIDVDIADVAAWVEAGDPVDREAQRRASTAYLPTGAVYMLPQRLGCELASLHPDAPRPVFRTTCWFDDSGALVRHELRRLDILVGRRLDYDEADRLLADPDSDLGASLRRAATVADALERARRDAGAFSFNRPEWKVRVSPDGQNIHIKPIERDSASRRLVSEMMILVNRLGAERAAEAGVPVIYRVQDRPTGDLPEIEPGDPTAFARLRGLIQPATLSLKPGWHWGLGLPAYTQLSSPLRRYADLVGQRQLRAALQDEPPVYGPQEMLKILANAEATERELKRVEAEVTQRWTLEWLKRQPEDAVHEAEVMGETPAGHRVMLTDCGAQGLLQDSRPHELGALVPVQVQRIRPRAGTLRLHPASPRGVSGGDLQKGASS